MGQVIVVEYEDDLGNYLGDLRQLLDLEGQLDSFVAFIGFDNPGCSVQLGLDYLKGVEDPRESIP